jgi:hypothetical protein
VLLIVTGEFGRPPRLEQKDGRIGRDHWPGAIRGEPIEELI